MISRTSHQPNYHKIAQTQTCYYSFVLYFDAQICLCPYVGPDVSSFLAHNVRGTELLTYESSNFSVGHPCQLGPF